ncbi:MULTISPECIES: hypothetical protein [Cysteiniphilum]|uniref:Type II/III secretion system secretin-like domain-containing protein n=1 Tax=Cysteiniphilum litorale TaxID=2056700 RepID=A0A8J2Z2S3_9GAMM|nr:MULTISPECIES: hypothetical protein [Cysteiniphilum]GGF92025.1 hypothetical protein GCM10010995_06490 [Cysteiniphilum litorale]
MSMKNLSKLKLSILVTVLLSSCANIEQTKKDAEQNYQSGADIFAKANEKQNASLISFDNNIYVATSSYKTKKPQEALPPLFDKKYVYNTGRALTLSEIVTAIAYDTGVNIRISDDAKSYLGMDDNSSSDDSNSSKQNKNQDNGTVVYYTGTLKGLFDTISSKYNLWWKYNKNQDSITLFRTETKTFDLDLLTGSQTSESKIQSNTSTESGDQNTKTSYNYGNYDPWKSTVDTIKSIIKKNGSVDASPTNGTLTVTTTPDIMEYVTSYIEKINEISGKRIAIKVDIYDVSTNNSSSYGLNWDAIYKVTQGSLSWSSTKVPVPLADPFNSSTMETATVTGGISSGPFAGSKIIASALQKLGKTSYVTGTIIYTVNGKPSPVKVDRTTAYVKQVSVTNSGGSSSSSDNIQTSVTPGTIDTGYSIVITPRIIRNNEVLMNISSNISQLEAMREKQFYSGGLTTPNTIELPDLRHKTFMQAVPLHSGQTAVLAGFQNNVNNTGTNSIGPSSTWALGGNQSTNHQQTITVIIVTPYIIDNWS